MRFSRAKRIVRSVSETGSSRSGARALRRGRRHAAARQPPGDREDDRRRRDQRRPPAGNAHQDAADDRPDEDRDERGASRSTRCRRPAPPRGGAAAGCCTSPARRASSARPSGRAPRAGRRRSRREADGGDRMMPISRSFTPRMMRDFSSLSAICPAVAEKRKNGRMKMPPAGSPAVGRPRPAPAPNANRMTRAFLNTLSLRAPRNCVQKNGANRRVLSSALWLIRSRLRPSATRFTTAASSDGGSPSGQLDGVDRRVRRSTPGLPSAGFKVGTGPGDSISCAGAARADRV